MDQLTSGKSGHTYQLLRSLPHFGEGFYQAYANSLEVTIRTAEIDTPEAVALRAEARLIEQIDSPRIIKQHDRGRTKTHVFLALEGPTERSLAEFISESDLAPTVALDILLQILEAIEALHTVGVAWGWLRPQAFWVDRTGKLKLLNVRGAGSSDVGGPVTLAAATYAAPERAANQAPTPQADIYAWGALAYELLSGRPPYAGSTVAELAVKHLSESVPDLALARSSLPAELCMLVNRCLSKASTERPQSVAELRAELEPMSKQLLDEEHARAVVCPRCQNQVLPQSRCPICNAPLLTAEAPKPIRRVKLAPLIAIGISGFVIVVMLAVLLGGGDNASASAVVQPSEVPTAAPTEPATPTSIPTPLPTATILPMPEGALVAAAQDVADPNIDIIRVQARTEDQTVTAEIDVAGQIYMLANRATYQIYFDVDGDPTSGDPTTPWSDFGADVTVLYRSGAAAAQALQWDGTTWQGLGAATTDIRGGQLQIAMPHTWIETSAPLRYAVIAANTESNLVDYAPARDD